MPRNKIKKFQEIEESEFVIEPSKPNFNHMKNNWKTNYFKNSNPIILELGCGKGEYTTGLAKLNPKINYIGIDIKGDRIWKGSQIAKNENLKNVAFLRIHILELNDFFSDNEIDGIWITFPDPRIKKRDEKRRIISPRYLEIYKKIIKPKQFVRLKTDNQLLFDYAINVLENRNDIYQFHLTHDLYDSYLHEDCQNIYTYYEFFFLNLGYSIKYLKFCFQKS